MRIVVLGSGVVGITLAYFLAQRGHGVTVIDKAASAGQATSFANGGQLSYSYTDSLADPTLLPKLPGLIAGKDPAFQMRLSADPALMSWGAQFLRNCTPERSRFNTENVLRLALHSRKVLHQLLNENPIEFDFRNSGKLHVYASEEALAKAGARVAMKNRWGCRQEVLGTAECLEREPALHKWEGDIAGGVFSPLDESGDAFSFVTEICRNCSDLGVQFAFNTEVKQLAVDRTRIAGVDTDNGRYEADAYVIALGAQSPLLTRVMGLKVPVYPIKGYSITVPATQSAPMVSITDTSKKVVYCLLGDRLRIAGMAELYGYDVSQDPEKIERLRDAARRAFPDAADYDRLLHQWSGFRPATPDSAPVLGRTPLANLFLNTGQGMLGWTLACGSASVVADIIDGAEPAIELRGLTYERFAA